MSTNNNVLVDSTLVYMYLLLSPLLYCRRTSFRLVLPETQFDLQCREFIHKVYCKFITRHFTLQCHFSFVLSTDIFSVQMHVHVYMFCYFHYLV